MKPTHRMKNVSWLGTSLTTLLLLLASGISHAQGGDSYIDTSMGRMILFALPGCDANGGHELYGLMELKDGTKKPACWKYDGVIHVYIGDVELLYRGDDVHVEGGASGDENGHTPIPRLRNAG